MMRIIDGLLKTAALEEGKVELNKTLYDMSRLVEEVVSCNQMQAQNKRQTLSFQAEPNCMVLVDTDRMREVIDNLISNAIKYSPEGKTIAVRVQHSKDDNDGGAPSVLVSVRDEGQGLTEEDMKKLFGKFQRLSAQPTAGESSTGLGLAIVKQLVELHGGKVWAESEGKNKGSIFCVKLPSASKTKRSNSHE
jgi:signal transduction histidine kinase